MNLRNLQLDAKLAVMTKTTISVPEVIRHVKTIIAIERQRTAGSPRVNTPHAKEALKESRKAVASALGEGVHALDRGRTSVQVKKVDKGWSVRIGANPRYSTGGLLPPKRTYAEEDQRRKDINVARERRIAAKKAQEIKDAQAAKPSPAFKNNPVLLTEKVITDQISRWYCAKDSE